MNSISKSTINRAPISLTCNKSRNNIERVIKLVVEYDGTDYLGFQRQNKGRTLQGELEKALKTVCRENVQIVTAGRTDTGVHALEQVCHFRTTTRLPSSILLKALNNTLPRDIVVHEAREMPEHFHARYKALSRSYAYFILNRSTPSALFKHCLKWIPCPLDVIAMNKACKYLLGEKDFSSFLKLGSTKRTPMTRILKARCSRGAGQLKIPFACFGKDLIVFYIQAETFLYSMVRTIMGTLLEVGKHQREPHEMEKIICARRREAAGPAISSKGLFLIKVEYPKHYR